MICKNCGLEKATKEDKETIKKFIKNFEQFVRLLEKASSEASALYDVPKISSPDIRNAMKKALGDLRSFENAAGKYVTNYKKVLTNLKEQRYKS